jgi:phosphopantothenoylcysteine decarboxylase
MANVLLGVTGSVAAILTPDLYAALKRAGHQVRVVATRASLYFFDPALLDPSDSHKPVRNPSVVVLDEDEWPGRDAGRHYERGDPVLHIELRRWADLYLIAPLDANTLAKLANGLADNCLTCVWRAWDRARPLVLAPAMNTLMWEHPFTARHLRQLAADDLDDPSTLEHEPERLVTWINQNCPHLRVVPPQSKRLACDDVGMGAMAPQGDIVKNVETLLAQVREITS